MKRPPLVTDADVEIVRMTLMEHAEAWYRKEGEQVPTRYSPGWWEMYTAWVEFAFGSEK